MTEFEQNQHQLFSGSFEDLGLSEPFLVGLRELGYVKATHVQTEVFKPASEGKDLVVQSRTGSGKTTAFSLPILTRIDTSKGAVQAIVLVPTRELARQVATEAGRIGHQAKIKIAAIYGGASFNAQISALNAGAHVVVGTPGRVRDLIERKHLRLDQVAFAVLDEADEMLSMGFWDDVTSILGRLPQARQTLLFSATLPDAIVAQLPQIVKEPLQLNLSSDTIGVKTIRHVIHIEDDAQPKARNLLNAIEFHHPTSSIVFCNTKEETEVVERYLRRFGYNARALNGDMPQSARERVMAEMREKRLDLIVATDVAARGIDISGISHVFNIELPENSEVYVHRTGRTGRIGKLGVAVNLIRAKDAMQLATLKDKFGIEFEEIALPPESEILWMQAERLAVMFVEAADSVEISQYRMVASSLLSRPDLAEIVAFLLRSHFSQATPKSVAQPSSEAPSRRHHAAPAPTAATPATKTVIAPVQIAPLPTPIKIAPKVQTPKEHLEEEAQAEGEPETEVESGPTQGAMRLYVTLGRDDGFKELNELAFYLAEGSDVDLGFFTGLGQLRDSSSHVEIESEYADKVIAAFHDKDRDMSRTKGANAAQPKIICEIAKGGGESKQRSRRPRRR